MHFLLSATLNINMSLKYINERKMIIISISIDGMAHIWLPDLYKKLYSIITLIDAKYLKYFVYNYESSELLTLRVTVESP